MQLNKMEIKNKAIKNKMEPIHCHGEQGSELYPQSWHARPKKTPYQRQNHSKEQGQGPHLTEPVTLDQGSPTFQTSGTTKIQNFKSHGPLI